MFRVHVPILTLVLISATAHGQNFGPPPPRFVSPEVKDDRSIVLRLHAPEAKVVRVSSSDFPSATPFGPGVEMTKGENGVWEATVGPFPAGAYRYGFNVDGLSVIDPRNPATSETNMNSWSLVSVPGSETCDLKDVPHGAVAQVQYFSKSLNRFRRAHVYTPPGYEARADKLPVLYLLHGAMDCDASWSTVGRAGLIMDNLIAAGKAVPMIVVMPMGHTGPFTFGPGGNLNDQMGEFAKDFVEDLRPLVEQRYRVSTERQHRAIAGLSMGGMQTLNISIADLDDYAYVGVFSSGVFGISGGFGGGGGGPSWEEQNKDALDNKDLKNGLKLFWFATGKDDFLVETTRGTVEMLKKHEFDVVYNETDGGHTWLNWRDYLPQFAGQLFRDGDVAAAPKAASASTKGVSGRWSAEFETQIGVQKYVFTLASAESKITGTATAEIGDEKHESKIEEGTIDGDRVSFVEQLDFQGNALRIEYSGTLSGDELKLERKVGDIATESLVAKRLTESRADSTPRRGRGRPGFGPPEGPPEPVTLQAAPAGFDRRRDGVAEGTVESVEYDSKTVGIKRRMVVYTPPGYSTEQQYPVLYLLHGIGGTEQQWTRDRAAEVLDNLMADKLIVPMIVVMPYGRASATPVPQNIFDRGEFETYGRFEQEILDDIIPYMESHYPVAKDREKRALAGLSMGGGQSLNIGLAHLDTFAWVGGFSSAPNTKPAKETVTDPEPATKQLRLLWISCGNRDGLMRVSKEYHEALDAMKVPHTWQVSAGGHDFDVWRNDLWHFSQKLFR